MIYMHFVIYVFTIICKTDDRTLLVGSSHYEMIEKNRKPCMKSDNI